MNNLLGLSSKEAKNRLEKLGPNTIVEPKRHPLLNFLKKFWGPIPWMLEFIFIMQLLLHERTSATITLFLLLFNAVVSFFQEKRAESALSLLKKKLQIKVRLLRDQKWITIDAQEIVVDDVIRIRMGDFVPADMKITEGEILADYSALTGESVPLELAAENLALSGARVKRGEATGVVVATGKRSFFGKTSELVLKAKEESHVEKTVLQIVKWLVLLDLLLVVLILVYSIFAQISFTEIIPFSLILLIASVPVAMPATFTLMSALSALKLSDNDVLVTRLYAIQEAAAMNLLLSDKTGTLTINRLTLEQVQPYLPFTQSDLLYAALLTSSEASQDPFDLAIFEKMGHRKFTEFESLIKFIPFDPKIKRAEAIIKENDKTIRVIKGSPQVVSHFVQDAQKTLKEADELASQGYRVLAIAKGEENNLSLVGFLAFLDPPRDESKKVVEELQHLGITVKMVTGDIAETAKAIGSQVGIGIRVCKRDEIETKELEKCDIFSDVFPEDKFLLVSSFERQNFIVGMTGDGVNDAPALKQANCGIAVQNATDVAKASASMILTKPGLKNLILAIKTGREVYRRMLSYTLNKIVKTLHVALFLSLGLLFENVFVVTPRLIMFLIFANDFVTMSLASDNVKISQAPSHWNIRFLVSSALVLALFWIGFSFAIFFTGRDYFELLLPELQTLIFLLLVLSGMATVYLVRNSGYFWQLRPGKLLFISTLSDIVVVCSLGYFGILMAPLSLTVIASLILAVSVFMVLLDIIKVRLFKWIWKGA